MVGRSKLICCSSTVSESKDLVWVFFIKNIRKSKDDNFCKKHITLKKLLRYLSLQIIKTPPQNHHILLVEMYNASWVLVAHACNPTYLGG
jgi:hypothetical protein